MKTHTQYAGIDYSNGRSNTDKANGIRYGVISQNTVSPDALDEILSHGTDLAWAEAMKQAEALHMAEQETLSEDERTEFDENETAEDLAMNWETSLSNYLYEQDGYKVTGCLDNDLFVLSSPFYTYAQFCSPCVPGAGNLNTPFQGTEQEAKEAGFPRVYCLGADWFEDGKAPYPIFKV